MRILRRMHSLGGAVLCLAATFPAWGQPPGRSLSGVASQGDLPAIEFDLVSIREPRNPGDPPERVREARVSLGGPAIRRLQGESEAPGSRSPVQQYLLRFRMTLHEPREGRHYQWVEVHFKFPDPHFRVLDLYPINIEGGGPEIEALSVDRDLRLVPGRTKACLGSVGVRFPPEQTVQGFGLGESKVYWRFSAESDQAVNSGTREGFMLLQAPAGLHAIEGTVWTSAVVGRLTAVGWWFFREAKSSSFEARWPIQ